MFKKVIVAFCFLHIWAFVLDLADVPRIDAVSAATKVKVKKVWLMKKKTGGVQCSRLEEATILDKMPEKAEKTVEEKATVYDEFKVHHPVCDACGCPEYSYNHYIQVNKADLDKFKGYKKVGRLDLRKAMKLAEQHCELIGLLGYSCQAFYMEYNILDDTDTGFFLIETYGDFDVDDDIKALGRVIRHEKWEKGKKLLVDHRQSTFDNLTVLQVVELSNVISAVDEQYGPSFCAIVVPSGVGDKAAFYKYDVCCKCNVKIEIFYSYEYQSAVDWLRNQ